MFELFLQMRRKVIHIKLLLPLPKVEVDVGPEPCKTAYDRPLGTRGGTGPSPTYYVEVRVRIE